MATITNQWSTPMQQLIIKLSPEATADYLAIASQQNASREMPQRTGSSGIDIDIKLSMLAGLHFADIDVNGQRIKPSSESEDLEIELLEIN